jgi:DNA-binding protein H-NS
MTHEKYTPEQEVALRYIEKIMSFWEITPADLRRAPAAAKPPPAPLKYRHPSSGEQWDGIGKQPQWLRDALLKEGLTVDELRPRTETARSDAD